MRESIAKYRIVEEVGSGGFSTIYLAREEAIDRSVAIKVMRAEEFSGGSERIERFTKRFKREARLLAKLRDQHTITMHDFGETDDGLLYMVFEYVDGQTLRGLFSREGALSPRRTVKLLRQILESLREAHAMGVLHRDVKPSNIMLFDHAGRTDRVKVLDFGIAIQHIQQERDLTEELTEESTILGTPRYMAPEQIRGEELGPESDLYSVGLLGYEMLTARKAVQADSTAGKIAEQVSSDPFVLPDDLDISPPLRRLLQSMLAKEPDRRPASAEEVLETLDSLETCTESNETPARHRTDLALEETEEPDPPDPELSGGWFDAPVDESDEFEVSRWSGLQGSGLLGAIASLALVVSLAGYCASSSSTTPSAADPTDDAVVEPAGVDDRSESTASTAAEKTDTAPTAASADPMVDAGRSAPPDEPPAKPPGESADAGPGPGGPVPVKESAATPPDIPPPAPDPEPGPEPSAPPDNPEPTEQPETSPEPQAPEEPPAGPSDDDGFFTLD